MDSRSKIKKEKIHGMFREQNFTPIKKELVFLVLYIGSEGTIKKDLGKI